jgi:hypothetical protein
MAPVAITPLAKTMPGATGRPLPDASAVKPPPSQNAPKTPPITRNRPSPVQMPRCTWGDRRNQPRRTTSWYIRSCTERRLAAKWFLSCDSSTVSAPLKMR